jgi:two-component system OmpR family response regulator
MKVLVVEDNEILSRNLTKFLDLNWIDSDQSFDWMDALYKWSTNYYDAIILDINLPEIDGLEVCEKLREKWKITPIVMLTSRSTKWDIVTWLESWADDYMT